MGILHGNGKIIIHQVGDKERSRSGTIGLGFVEIFRRFSLSVVWAWTTHFFTFLAKCGRCLAGISSTNGMFSLKGVAEPLQTITAILLVSKSLLKIRVFVDDVTAFSW